MARIVSTSHLANLRAMWARCEVQGKCDCGGQWHASALPDWAVRAQRWASERRGRARPLCDARAWAARPKACDTRSRVPGGAAAPRLGTSSAARWDEVGCYHFSRARDSNFLVAAKAAKKVESQLPGLTRTEEEKGLLPLRKLHSFQSYHFSRARDS